MATRPVPEPLKPNETRASPVPEIAVARLPPGRYLARLVVVRADGTESPPAERLLEIV